MKPPASKPLAIMHALLLLLLLVGNAALEVMALHAGNKNQHDLGHHHQGHHHEGHHHGHHHNARAPRTRREESSPEPTGSAEGETDAASSEKIPCTGNPDCSGLLGSYCDTSSSYCSCTVKYPIADYVYGHCVAEAKLASGCSYTSECESSDEYSFCGPEKTCICKEGYTMVEYPNVGFNCVMKSPKSTGGSDPAMIGGLVAMAIMFVIICVVLRLFSKARFRENRSIFNTPNPRLMNASLFKDSGVAGRRGSAMSAVSATGSAAPSGGAAPKTPSPAKESKNKSETTVAIENVD